MAITDTLGQITDLTQQLPDLIEEMRKKADKAAQNIEIIKWCAIGVAGVALLVLFCKMFAIIERIKVCAIVGSVRPFFKLSGVEVKNVVSVNNGGSKLLEARNADAIQNFPLMDPASAEDGFSTVGFYGGPSYKVPNAALPRIGCGR